ncbi:hypothetical protein [Mycobacterium sp. GA-2829]|uniref:hypothetical protein n=1 Tax=Mycobacterium sp. GA-2829 TaxID=1772283 RepID=UPI000AE8BC05|nr:hypothetical protein [Mycobacterium sp. GA-2829]
MASNRYIGYVGRLAVAVGVGAAVAVASTGTAYAETESTSSATHADSEKPSAGNAETKAPDETASDERASEDTASDEPADDEAPEDEPADDEPADDEPAEKPSLTKKLRHSAERFEAEQVEKLRSVFTPRPIDDAEPETERLTGAQDEPADEPAPVAAAATATPRVSDPFRPTDPDPDGVPDAVLGLRNLLMGAVGPEFRPYVREGVEAIYRGSQIVPFVNTVVPAYKIVPALFEAAQGNRSGAQVIINELLLTTGPVSLLYYGYDQIADLANMEPQARLLKEQFYASVWDTVDPLALLHVAGQHGLR